MTIVLKRNDVGKDLNFTVLDSSGDVLDLSSVSDVIFKTKAINATTVSISSECTITSASDGLCRYTTAAGDLSSTGNYLAELEIVYGDGEKNTADLQDVYVSGDL